MAWHGAHEIVALLLRETSAISMIHQPELDGTTSLDSALIGANRLAIDGVIVPAKMMVETVEKAIEELVSLLHADELAQ